ncbi:hypothetical protein D3C71_1830600 [compost metagenome]
MLAFGRIGCKSAVFEKQQIPGGHAKAQVEREGQVGQRIFLIDRLHAVHEVGIQRLDVRIAQPGIRGIGHGGIEVGAIGTDPVPDGTSKLLFAITANALRV